MFRKIVLLVLSASLAGIARAEPAGVAKDARAPVVDAIDVKKGDQWTYEIRDDITDTLKFTSTLAVTTVTGTEIDVRLRNKTAVTNVESTGLEIFDRRWRMTEGPRGLYKQYQPTSGIPEGIAVGKQWAYSYDFTDSIARAVTWTGHGEVQAWEKVTLPSGQSFDAFRIEFVETPAKGSTSMVVGLGVNQHKRIEFKVVEWYAPTVNRSIKRVFETRQNGKLVDSATEVLIGYSRAETR